MAVCDCGSVSGSFHGGCPLEDRSVAGPISRREVVIRIFGSNPVVRKVFFTFRRAYIKLGSRGGRGRNACSLSGILFCRSADDPTIPPLLPWRKPTEKRRSDHVWSVRNVSVNKTDCEIKDQSLFIELRIPSDS